MKYDAQDPVIKKEVRKRLSSLRECGLVRLFLGKSIVLKDNILIM
jgi:hypothetical protein